MALSRIALSHAAAVGVVLLLTTAVYARALSFPFVYEDKNESGAIESGQHLGQVFSRNTLGHRQLTLSPRLVTALTFALQAGSRPWAYHAVNLALHLAVVALVACLAGIWGGDPIWAALLVGLHPINTEAVAYVSGRSEVLATLLGLLAVWLLVESRGVGVVLALLVGLLALGAKETTVAALPIVCWLTLKWRQGVTRATFFALAIWTSAIAIGAWHWVGTRGLGEGLSLHTWARESLAYLAQAWRLIGRLIVLHGQRVDDRALLNPWAWVGAVLLTAGLLGVVLVLWRRGSVWAWGLSSAFLLMVPRLVIPQTELPHEHALYFPLVLLALMVSVGLSSRRVPTKECV